MFSASDGGVTKGDSVYACNLYDVLVREGLVCPSRESFFAGLENSLVESEDGEKKFSELTSWLDEDTLDFLELTGDLDDLYLCAARYAQNQLEQRGGSPYSPLVPASECCCSSPTLFSPCEGSPSDLRTPVMVESSSSESIFDNSFDEPKEFVIENSFSDISIDPPDPISSVYLFYKNFCGMSTQTLEAFCNRVQRNSRVVRESSCVVIVLLMHLQSRLNKELVELLIKRREDRVKKRYCSRDSVFDEDQEEDDILGWKAASVKACNAILALPLPSSCVLRAIVAAMTVSVKMCSDNKYPMGYFAKLFGCAIKEVKLWERRFLETMQFSDLHVTVQELNRVFCGTMSNAVADEFQFDVKKYNFPVTPMLCAKYSTGATSVTRQRCLGLRSYSNTPLKTSLLDSLNDVPMMTQLPFAHETENGELLSQQVPPSISHSVMLFKPQVGLLSKEHSNDTNGNSNRSMPSNKHHSSAPTTGKPSVNRLIKESRCKLTRKKNQVSTSCVSTTQLFGTDSMMVSGTHRCSSMQGEGLTVDEQPSPSSLGLFTRMLDVEPKQGSSTASTNQQASPCLPLNFDNEADAVTPITVTGISFFVSRLD